MREQLEKEAKKKGDKKFIKVLDRTTGAIIYNSFKSAQALNKYKKGLNLKYFKILDESGLK